MKTTWSWMVVAALIAVGCSDDTAQISTNNTNTNNGADAGADASQRPDAVVMVPKVVSIMIEPSTVTLVSSGTEVGQDFQLLATRDDGSTVPYAGLVEWTFDEARIGRIGERDGQFVANGLVGGPGRVTAKLDDNSLPPVTADVRVTLERTFMGPNTPMDAANLFANGSTTDAARQASIVYPLEGAVMPQNVFPADIQWLVGAAEDVFRVRLTKDDIVVNAYLKHTGPGFGNHWLVDEAMWRAVAQTNPDADLTIEVDRWEASTQQVITTPPVRMRFANAALSGSVYYWDIQAGRIVRINDGSGVREEFMPTPPMSPNGEQCVGCHTVSQDGRYMAGRLGGGYNAGAIFDLTKDLAGSPPPTEYNVSNQSAYWNFSTWSPDNSRLVVSGNEWALEGMKLVDPFTGQVLPVAAGALPGSGSTHPAWSPDGSLLAYVSNAGGFGGSNVTGDISVLEVTGMDAFGAARTLQAGNAVPNAQPAGNAASYPSWTPDSQWIAFAHGTGSRSEDQQSALYMIKADGTGLTRLDNASGGPSASDTFQPNFSPFHQGGYHWVTYLTRRDYGNSEVGTRGTGLQQVWVSAVSDTPGAGDPSEVGYWLPGQNTASRNISAYWAPRACRNDGEGCAVGAECCSGECLPGPDDALVCSPPPPDRCREIGESCNQTADCCGADNNVVCQANSCIRVLN
ncbi:MAG: hypothetical protein R3E66_05720 [bacterium]